MRPARIGLVFFVIGLIVMVGDVFYGKHIQDEVTSLGLAGIESRDGPAGVLRVLLFAFSYPLGAGLSLLGALLCGATGTSRLMRMGGWALLLILVPLLSPGILGSQHSPSYFGYGGITIMVLTALAMWFWGQYRLRVPESMRAAADWQGLGYFAFALAAWNLCGFGGMPSFAVYPEKMIALQAIPFAVAQLKAVMALFILGFVFTAFGLWCGAQAARRTKGDATPVS